MARAGDAARTAMGHIARRCPDGVLDWGLRTLDRLSLASGTCVYERDWDVLIVLDACRQDMYERLIRPNPGLRSVASTSTVWMDRTFGPAYDHEVANTAYVSANPYSHRLDETRFERVEHVWQDAWDEELGTIPPEPVTDRAIAIARRESHARLIVHYMQPHFPFIAGDQRLGRLGRGGFGLGDDSSENVWRLVEQGELDAATVRTGYDANLKYVFGAVEPIFENVDGRVVVTADHGNALGEWGMWGHRAYVPIAALREVPWDAYKCHDKGSYEPDVELNPPDQADTDSVVREQLRALGYTED